MRQADKKSNKEALRYAVAALLIAHFVAPTDSQAFPYELSYASRITDAQGVPLTGPVDIQVDFFTDPTNSNSRINIQPVTISKVPLADGVFQLSITLTPVEFNTVFANSDDTVYIQVTDVTHGKTFQRQQFGAAPYALKIPIDNDALRFNNQGQLTVGTNAPAKGQVLIADSAGKLKWTDLSGPSLTITTPISGQILGYDGAHWVPQSAPSGGAGGGGSSINALTGDVVASGGGSVSATLSTTGVAAGTYSKVTVDAKGRVSAGMPLTAADIPPLSAGMITSGTLSVANGGTGANLSSTGGIGQYLKQTTAGGSVTVGTIAASDITSSLGFTPLNKAGDTISGVLNFGSYDLTSAGNIQMAASKTFTLSGNTADPTGLLSGDKGKTWFNSTTNQIKYWDGSTAVALGVAGSGLSSFNGQTGNTQTLKVPGTSGTGPAWSSAANVHTLNIPLASTASVTAGLISNTDYNAFNGKVAGVTSGEGVTVSRTGNIATVNLAAAGTAGTHAKVTTDAYGRVTAGTTLVEADLPPHSAALLTSGTLSVANGGTGLSSAPATDQIPIGNGTGYSLATLSAGSGISISNSSGSVTVSATGDATTKVSKSGDIMTGTLTLPANGLVAGTNQLVLVGGNVGIGTTGPTSVLDVRGDLTIGGPGGTAAPIRLKTSSSGKAIKVQGTHDNNDPALVTEIGLYDNTNNNIMAFFGDMSTSDNHTVVWARNDLRLLPGSGSAEVRFTSTGNVGIGITSPGAKLDINGTIKISGGTPGAGKVLTSDANGLASWSTAAVGSITGITAGTGLTGGGTSGSVTLNADVGTTANKLVQLDATAKLPAVDGSALTNINPASLSSAVSVAKGGTGLTSGTSGGIPYFNAASTMATSAALTANGVVLGGGAGVAPTSTTAGTANTVLRVPSGGGAPGFGALDVSQTSTVTGALNVGNGGTGTSLLATGGTGQYLKQIASGAAVSVGTIAAADLPTMVGDSGSGGTKGAVPAPVSGDSAAGKFLKADGSWSVPSSTVDWAEPGTIGSTTPNFGAFTTVTTTGNVGIGTASPSAKIHLVDEVNYGWLYTQYNNGDGTNFRNQRARGTVAAPAAVQSGDRLGSFLAGGYNGSFFNGMSGGLSIYAAENFTAANTAATYVTLSTMQTGTTPTLGGTERMRVTQDGNVGIGAIAPLNKLDVAGGMAIGATYGGGTSASGSTAPSNGLIVQGNVGIGTTAPRSKLDVNGTLLVPAAVNNTSTTINFSTGNLQFTNLSCQAFTLNNMSDGGSYTLAIKGTSSALCSFVARDTSNNTLTVHLPPDHQATILNNHTIYSFMVIGADVYISWIPGI